MKVWTHSDPAINAQKGVMEFLLIVILWTARSASGRECQLQISRRLRASNSRYTEPSGVFNKNLGSLIATDMTRCIHCTRCVRFRGKSQG